MKNAARARRQGIGNARCRTVVPTVIYLREDRSESYSKRIPGVDPRLTTSTTTLRRRPPSTERVATAYVASFAIDPPFLNTRPLLSLLSITT